MRFIMLKPRDYLVTKTSRSDCPVSPSLMNATLWRMKTLWPKPGGPGLEFVASLYVPSRSHHVTTSGNHVSKPRHEGHSMSLNRRRHARLCGRITSSQQMNKQTDKKNNHHREPDNWCIQNYSNLELIWIITDRCWNFRKYEYVQRWLFKCFTLQKRPSDLHTWRDSDFEYVMQAETDLGTECTLPPVTAKQMV